MIKKIDTKVMDHNDHGGHHGLHHFSFADYIHPENMSFGVIRAIDDEVIEPHMGFGMHPHNNMEIITYIVDGEIAHMDTTGQGGILKAGDVQYMTAGTGIEHSEYNYNNEDLRVFQIWIKPNVRDVIPNYGDYHAIEGDRSNKWLHVVSSYDGTGRVHIHQDANLYATITEEPISFEVKPERQIYLIQVKGSSTINEIDMKISDALESIEEDIVITPKEKSEFIIIEMAKS